MNSASSFKEFYETSFSNGNNQVQAQKLANEFFTDFIHNIPLKMDVLESYLTEGHFDLFYMSLADLKYLIEFSDNLSRYWHFLRGYSEALSKLRADFSVKGAKSLYVNYFVKYGDRRFLRNEHWFEKKRWEFLDEMVNIYSEDDLRQFFIKYQQALAENLKIYISFILAFVKDLEKLTVTHPSDITVKKL